VLIPARVRRYAADAGHAFEHGPVEVSISVLLAAAYSWTLESPAEPFREWVELVVTGVLIAGTAFAATLLHALGRISSRTRWIITLTGAVLAALYGIFVLNLELAAEAWRAGALVAGAALLLLASPSFGAARDDATADFRTLAGRIVLRILAVALYALALFAGLGLALGAVNTLFELDFDAKIYFHVFGWIFAVLVPWAVVGGLPEFVRPAAERSGVAAAVHRLSAFLVPPLLAIYYLILYAYAVRIGVTGELPKNLVSPLVIAAGLIAGLALVLFDRQDDNARGAAVLDDDEAARSARAIQPLRFAAPLFLPLAGLGVYALSLRFGQYGWTEFRALRTVLLVVLGLIAAGATYVVVRRRRLPLHLLPILLAAALLLAVIGPWNVLAASRRSQQARLTDALAQAGVVNGAVTGDTLIANALYDDISSTSRYLATHFGPAALPAALQRHGAGEPWIDYAYAVGLRREATQPADARGMFVQLMDGAALPDGAGGTLTYLRVESFQSPAQLQSNTARADSLRVTFVNAGDTLTADLAPVLAGLNESHRSAGLPPGLARVPVFDPAGAPRGELLILEVGFAGEPALRLFRLVALLRQPAP
jgi:hypothetical protein